MIKLRVKLSHKLSSEGHMTIIIWWFQQKKRYINYKKSCLQLLNCKWIPITRNTSKITVVIELDLRRWKQMELCLKALGYFDQSKKVTQSCLCLWQQRRNVAALIPPPWASNPKLGSHPLELGSKEFLFPELFQSNRKYIRR